MKVITHEDFKQAYTQEPAAVPGRIESILAAIQGDVEFIEAYPAGLDDISLVHSPAHIKSVERQGLYRISALAAGGAMEAALTGLSEPSFAVVRPPGHHASSESSWGFCYFNNMAIALEHLRQKGLIKTAYVLDFDLHYGDGTVNILEEKGYVAIHNPGPDDRKPYLSEIERHLARAKVDIIGVSAGFDNHMLDWGGLLTTEDYHTIGRMVFDTCKRLGIGAFGILEGGYNHDVLGKNVAAFLKGFEGRPYDG
jgi:acetoin utilization deacetylase AcuC-like enzyme